MSDPVFTRSRRARARRSVLAVGGLVGLALLLASCAVPTARLTFTFESASNPLTIIGDAGGANHVGTVETAGGPGARVAIVSPGNGGSSRAASFPALCLNATPGCSRAVITVPSSSDHDPGTADFTFGTSVRVQASELTSDHGSNLMQKGKWNTPQWKLQIDDATGGRPSCVLRSGSGGTGAITVTASRGVADGTWHELRCRRLGGVLEIVIDGQAAGQTPVPANVSVRPVGQPIAIGGNGAYQHNDQYHGDLDDVTFGVY